MTSWSCSWFFTSAMLLLLLLLLPQGLSENCTKPKNVRFSSKNLQNSVEWSTPSSVSDEILYSVEYKSYGDPVWHRKPECAAIKETRCDLSNETSDYSAQYYARVNVTQTFCSAETDRFYPKMDTIIGSPKIKVIPGEKSFLINLSYPEFYKGCEKPLSAFRSIKFEVSLNNTKSPPGFRVKSQNNTYSVEHLTPGTIYCVTAKVIFRLSRPKSETAVFCTTTLKDYSSEEAMKIICAYILPILVISVILLITVYAVHKYIHVSQLAQPRILILDQQNTLTKIIVEANLVTINHLSTENDTCKLKFQDIGSCKEEKIQCNKKSHLIKTASCGTKMMEIQNNSSTTVAGEEENLGYVTLQQEFPAEQPSLLQYDMTQTDQPPISEPVIPLVKQNVFSPYDMPHDLRNLQSSTQSKSSVYLGTVLEVPYAHINTNSSVCLTKEENTLNVTGNTYEPQMPMAKCYDDLLLLSSRETSKQHMITSEENCFNQDFGHHSLNNNDLCESNYLFVDWNPLTHQLHIPNFHGEEVIEEDITSDNFNVTNELLPKLIYPNDSDNSVEEDLLLKFQERWALNIPINQ
ncbi:interleukin-20 receptor subunit alpha [Xenopus laevis]|uniref:Fibronectin type-III domain-containing protein n=2 Tax=Xenopus laevis TaxID=8355 RepID=A0A974CST2_XENLA|nr:interleukin-20 receptor subunit alpha [Xenopus laevis]OCT78006.1 hypothetical protein XELAEV_18029103mg [Xenopus laevis]